MRSDYQKWLARNEKPTEKQELTKAEKRANWWHYNKYFVFAGIAVLLLVAWFVYDTQINVPATPDLQVAYLGSKALSDKDVSALESALAEQLEDLNGDGQVLVQVNQYLITMEEDGYMTLLAERTNLMADISNCDSFLFLMEDPAAAQTAYGFLAYPDGTEPEITDSVPEGLWLAWKDCPALTSLLAEENQTVFSQLYIGRRGVSESDHCTYLESYVALWEKLIAGAQ